MLLLTFLLFSLPPRGAPPETWPKYKQSTDLDKKTFKCFDGSKTISLTKFNDNYPDCPDFSDEPGSSFDSGTKFYCANKGWEPQYIDKWKVDDGICDCCDCSDETNATLLKENTDACTLLSNRKKTLSAYFGMIYQQGYEMYKKYSKEGEDNYKRQIYEKARLDSKVSILEQIRQRIIDKKPYDDLKDPDDFIPYEDFIPPPKNLEEGESEETKPENDDNNNYNDYNEMADDEDEYRYDRYYDYYRYNHYYNPEEFYRNDYTYEYIPPVEEPPTSNEQQNVYPLDYNDDTPVNVDNTVSEKKETIPDNAFRKFFKKIWNITFLFPDQKYLFQSNTETNDVRNHEYNNNYDYGYHPYDPETTAKLAAIDEKLNPARQELYNFDQMNGLDPSIDKAYFQLYKKSFNLGEYSLNFFDDFKIGYDYLGSFKSINETTNVMYFNDGSYCQAGESHSKSIKVYLNCWNNDKLVDVIRNDECSYEAVFLTPAACSNAMDHLHKMSLEELENLNDITGANL